MARDRQEVLESIDRGEQELATVKDANLQPGRLDAPRVIGAGATAYRQPTDHGLLCMTRIASRYWQIYATADGVSWAPVTGGTGAVTNVGVGAQAPSAVSISPTGLIEFTANAAAFTNSDPSGYASFSYTLPTGLGYENSSTFGFRVLSVWAPGGSGYVAAAPSLTYAGTGAGASILIDMVTVSAVPEPATLGLTASCLLAATRMRRRRR